MCAMNILEPWTDTDLLRERAVTVLCLEHIGKG